MAAPGDGTARGSGRRQAAGAGGRRQVAGAGGRWQEQAAGGRGRWQEQAAGGRQVIGAVLEFSFGCRLDVLKEAISFVFYKGLKAY